MTFKVDGKEDLRRLIKKKDTWVPPKQLDLFLHLVRKVISSSKYTDLYKETSLDELHAIIKIKARRCFHSSEVDLEEVVDIASYAALLFLRSVEKAEK